ncbi:MAG: SDR family NAD(P)-dependent oxidoreductase [Pseudomonadota bacterium]|nr:SDR family NAD(P)-dependent oxidoreductase [Pseudomonadota bacterium]
MDIADKIAFVTGGSGGLGSVIARHLAAHGANVAISYGQNADAAEAVKRNSPPWAAPVVSCRWTKQRPRPLIKLLTRWFQAWAVSIFW